MQPRIWAILGKNRGDNSQVLALAEALGLPFEIKQLDYRRHAKRPRWLGATLRTLTPESVELVAGAPPDLTISIGHRSVPVVRALRKRSRGRTRSVHLGNPRVHPRNFDLVLTTPQYGVRPARNIVKLPISLGQPAATGEVPAATRTFLERLPSPRRLLLIGGKATNWKLDREAIRAGLRTLLDQAAESGGSVMATSSPRTSPAVVRLVEEEIAAASVPAAFVPFGSEPRYAELLQAAEAITVTGDSVSMMSEAVSTGKPVGIIPLTLSGKGRRRSRFNWLRGGRLPRRDLRYFWAELQRRGLAGTVERPVAGDVPDVLGEAVARVRQLLARLAPQATGGHDACRSARENPA